MMFIMIVCMGIVLAPAEVSLDLKTSARRDLQGTCDADVGKAVTDDCVCDTDSASTCNVGKFCWDSECTDEARCKPRTNAQRKAFFGAKLHGTWNSDMRQMSMYLPAPHDIKITSIVWKDAQDPNVLEYTSAEHGLWTIDTTYNPCVPQYTLKVPEAIFFGPGSRFTLTGKKMDTKLQVIGTEQVHQNIDGYVYNYEHQIKTEVHLDIELVQQVTVSAHFITQYEPSPTTNTIKIDANYDELNANSADFLDECSKMFSGVTCTAIAPEVIITFEGEQNAVQAAINALNEAGIYQSENFGPYVVVQAHTEFVFVLESENEDLENGDLEVKMLLQVHSRSCIDHSNGNGVEVDALSAQYLKAASPPTYEWIMDETDPNSVAHQFINNLCVETIWWTFIPREYESHSYNIALDWHLRNGLADFVTRAEIDIQRADVLATIGFSSDVNLYKDEACTIPAEYFVLGDPFYAKITLTDMIVEAESITCDSMSIEQSGLDGDEISTDLKADPQYNFYEAQAGVNSVICGAELESTHFKVSVDGYHTDLKMDITVNYVQGAQLDSRRRMLALPFATEEREPDKKSVVIPFEIKSPGEIEVAAFTFEQLMQEKGSRLALLAFVAGVGYAAYSVARRGKSDEYNALLKN